MLLYRLGQLLVLQSETLGRCVLRGILILPGLHSVELLLGCDQTICHDLRRSLDRIAILLCSVSQAIGLMQVTQ